MIACEACYTDLCLEVGALLANGVIPSTERRTLLAPLILGAMLVHDALHAAPFQADEATSMHRFAIAVFVGGHPLTAATAAACVIEQRQRALFPLG